MHILEEHAIEWARLTHVGFGLLMSRGLNPFMQRLTPWNEHILQG